MVNSSLYSPLCFKYKLLDKCYGTSEQTFHVLYIFCKIYINSSGAL